MYLVSAARFPLRVELLSGIVGYSEFFNRHQEVLQEIIRNVEIIRALNRDDMSPEQSRTNCEPQNGADSEVLNCITVTRM